MKRRLFLAWRLSPGNGREVAAAMARVIGAAAGALRAVPSGSEHLTLVFLGERDVSMTDLLNALDPVRAIGRFRIRLGGARVFPRSGRPRVVCLDFLEGERELADLAEAVRGMLVPLLPDLAEYRVKLPHVTLARLARGARRHDGRAVGELLASSGLSSWSASDRVERIEIIRSELSHRGPSYETVGEIALAAG